MNLQKFAMLYISTLSKEMRSKTLIFLLVFTLIILGLGGALYHFLVNEVLTDMSAVMVGNQSVKVFFVFISFWSGILTVFFGVGCVKTDFDNNVISQILSFPVKRLEYLVARILGTMTIIFGYYVISLLAAVITFSLSSGGLTLGTGLIYSLLASALPMMALILLSILVSLYFNKLLAFFGVMFLSLILGVSNAFLTDKPFDEVFSDLSFFKVLGIFFHWFFPRVSTWQDISNALIMDQAVKANIGMELAHYFVIFGVWFILAAWIFRKKDI